MFMNIDKTLFLHYLYKNTIISFKHQVKNYD